MFSSAIRVALVISALSILAISLRAQQPRINEVVSLNGTGLQDFEGDFPDWIELYNPGSEALNLLNYAISDDYVDTDPWVLPDIELPPNGYIVIFASGKDLINSAEFHTHFKISSEGEEIYLFTPDGNVADQVTVPELSQDKSFGRFTDGAPTWSRLDIATPGASNSLSNHIKFSHGSGFYDSEFSLELFSLTGDSIYYTTDGSVPTPMSTLYVGEIEIKDRSDEPNIISEIPTSHQDTTATSWKSPGHRVAKATILRFASYRNSAVNSAVYTCEFFVGSTSNRYTLPVVSLVTEEGNFFDSDTGIYVPGQHFNPEDSVWSGNYFQRGIEWERNVHISYFPNDGSTGFSQDAGVRIHGGKSRGYAQKSLRLYARKEYGAQYFDYPLMPNRNIYRYKRFILRSTMGGWEGQSMLADDLAQRLSSGMNFEHQDSRAVIVFINGEYWGIHSIKDRIDEWYFEYTGSAIKDSVIYRNEDILDYSKLLDYAEDNDLSNPENYGAISEMMDLNNYIDYQIAQHFFINYDWPANNLTAWKRSPAQGLWRWVFYDIDAGFGTPNFNMMGHATHNDSTINWPNPSWSTVLFRSLLENDDFADKFISQFAEHLNTYFQPERTLGILDQMGAVWEPEIVEHSERWHYPLSFDNWSSDVDSLKDFLKERPCYVKKHVVEFFGLTSFNFNCSDATDSENLDAVFSVAPNPNKGSFSVLNITDEDWENLEIAIYNVNGSLIYNRSGLSLPSNGSISIDLGSIADGLYITELRSEKRVERLKIIIGE